MKKKIFVVMTFLLCFMVLGFMKEERYVEGAADMKLIITTPGEDASSSVNVIWHSKTQSSYLEYTQASDTGFNTPVLKMPLKTEQRTFYDDRSRITYNFYKNDLTITGLNPGSSYIYRIRENNQYSPVKSFKTAPREGSSIMKTEGFNFVFLSDYHTWTNGPVRLNTAVSVYNKAKEKANGNV
ncbi:MAG TPA: fibronectin type III domain-containing protein, partial [Bacilli bacterium]|nr:fibronectin type III domain-containing protein [Bacilli bacterium]